MKKAVPVSIVRDQHHPFIPHARASHPAYPHPSSLRLLSTSCCLSRHSARRIATISPGEEKFLPLAVATSFNPFQTSPLTLMVRLNIVFYYLNSDRAGSSFFHDCASGHSAAPT